MRALIEAVREREQQREQLSLGSSVLMCGSFRFTASTHEAVYDGFHHEA